MWVHQLRIDVGGTRVALRSDARGPLEMWESAYAPWSTAGDDYDATFGIQFGETIDNRRPLPTLWHGNRAVLRSRSAERLLHRLDLILQRLNEPAAAESLYRLPFMGAMQRDRYTVLLPSLQRIGSLRTERRYVDSGWSVADEDAVQFDPTSADIVIHPGLAQDPPWVEQLAGMAEPGRFTIDRMYWPIEHEHRADVVRQIMELTSDVTPSNSQHLLDFAATLSERLDCTAATPPPESLPRAFDAGC